MGYIYIACTSKVTYIKEVLMENILINFIQDVDIILDEFERTKDYRFKMYIQHYLKDALNIVNDVGSYSRISSQSVGYAQNGGDVNFELADRMYHTEILFSEYVFDYLFSDDNQSILDAIFHTESILISNVDDEKLGQFVQIIHTLNVVVLNILNQTPVTYDHR